MAVVVMLAVGVAGVGVWMARSAEKPGIPLPGKEGFSKPVAVGTTPVQPLPTLPNSPTQAPVGAAGRTEPPAPPPVVLEAVEPMLELNAIAAGGVGEANAGDVTWAIDELLGGKHAGKTKTELQHSWVSVQAVLDQQRSPDLNPKARIYTDEAISALQIEAAWLKEQVYK